MGTQTIFVGIHEVSAFCGIQELSAHRVCKELINHNCRGLVSFCFMYLVLCTKSENK